MGQVVEGGGGGGPGALQCTGCETQQHTVRVEITGQAEGGCQQILSIPCDGEGARVCTRSECYGVKRKLERSRTQFKRNNSTALKWLDLGFRTGGKLGTTNNQEGRLRGRTRVSCDNETPKPGRA